MSPRLQRSRVDTSAVHPAGSHQPGGTLRISPFWSWDSRNPSAISSMTLWPTSSGWWLTYPSEKYESQWEGWHPMYYGKIKTCSKPPTNIMIEHHDSSVNQVSLKICRFFPWQTVSLQEGISQISALKYHEIPISFSHPGRVPGRFPLGSGELLGDNMGGDRGEARRSEECPRLRSYGAPKKKQGDVGFHSQVPQ